MGNLHKNEPLFDEQVQSTQVQENLVHYNEEQCSEPVGEWTLTVIIVMENSESYVIETRQDMNGQPIQLRY